MDIDCCADVRLNHDRGLVALVYSKLLALD
jgi:hypothetical protein